MWEDSCDDELEWINKWNGELPTYMMGSGQGVMFNLSK